jgi:hypothetical protein
MPDVPVLNEYPIIQGAIALVIVLAWLVTWLRGSKAAEEKHWDDADTSQAIMYHMFLSGDIRRLLDQIKSIDENIEKQTELLSSILDELDRRK